MKVLVIQARGLPVGFVSVYGNDWVEMPALDRLAAEGVVFENHLADDPDAEGATRSWRRGIHALSPLPPEGEAADLLPLLGQRGVWRGLVRDGSRPFVEEFGQGWDRLIVSQQGDEGTAMEYALESWQAALSESQHAENWLLWLELATVLPPWDVPVAYQVRYMVDIDQDEEEEEDEEIPEPLTPLPIPPQGPHPVEDDVTFLRLQLTGAGAATYLDAGIGLILEELERRELLDSVLIVLTSDQGQQLGEHGMIGPDGPSVHEERIHVPLLMRGPGLGSRGRRVSALTQPMDLMPTLLEAFGIKPPEGLTGRSLLDLARGTMAEHHAYLVAARGEERALRTPEWAYVHFPSRLGRLFVKPEDRCEVNDVAQHHLILCERFEALLSAFAEAAQRPGALQPPPLPDLDREDLP